MSESPSARPATVALAYAILCVVWGSTYLFIKLGVDVLPPFLLGGTRFCVAGIALLFACWIARRPLPGRAAMPSLVLVGTLLLVVGNGLLNLSERYISSGLAALLVAAMPLWLTLLAMIGARGERLAPVGWVGLLFALAGVAILVQPFEGEATSWVGVAAVMGSSLSWSVGTVIAGRRLRSVDPFAASAVETALAGPLMFAVHFAFERGQPVAWGGQAWLAVGYLALMGSLVAFTAFVYLTAHMSSSKVGTYTYVNPVVAVFLGWLVLDERLSWRLAAGGAAILGGLLLVYAARVRRGASHPPPLRGSAPAPGPGREN